MNIESELTKRIGPAGASSIRPAAAMIRWLSTFAFYCRDQVDAIIASIRDLQRSLVPAWRARMPSCQAYTHLQRGQPVLYAHHLLAYVEMLDRMLHA